MKPPSFRTVTHSQSVTVSHSQSLSVTQSLSLLCHCSTATSFLACLLACLWLLLISDDF